MNPLIKLLLFVASTSFAFMAVNSNKNESFVPFFLCDIKPEAINVLYDCIVTLLPPKCTEVLDVKLEKFKKNRPLTTYVTELCKTAPKLLSNAFLLITNLVQKEFQAQTMVVLEVCWNATAYWIPYEPKTRYQDIQLFH
ncbi:uncharacterized protein LOC111261960 isoform X2 [Varroa jacobsoni]|uniref:Uncharacterized protein n=2 Tax=Varroa destructor TaxID=109461 RepID=A0A7M7JVL5_VARDE|nr:uncharacterized protein LOC111248965 isoform X1 [Varroa destructor]XP_022691620.1 uncharacterized protein LOC111261960 isoform X2 [Varroa jacobsoni]